MNDLVFVMYNQKLKGKKVKNVQLADLDSDDEWITEDVEVGAHEEEGNEEVPFEFQNVENIAAPALIDDLEIHDLSNDSDNVDDDLMDDLDID